MNRRLLALLVAAALVLAGAGVLGWRLTHRASDYERATDTLPASTLRALYTDWAGVRSLAAGEDLGAGASAHAVQRFLERAYDQDLVATSAVSQSSYVLERRYGVSPLDAEWEIYGQSRKGAVDVMKIGESVDLAGVERNLRTLGYTPPAAGSGTGGVWRGSTDLVTRIDRSLSPVQQNVVVLPDRRLVLMSDNAAYASAAAEVARGDRPSLMSTDGVPDLAATGEQPVTAVMWASDFACEDLSMGNADAEDQRVADQLVTEAGGVSPLSGLVMANQRDDTLVVGMHFEDSDQASRNLQPRTDLATGDAPGQGGTFPERFTVTSAEASGSDVVLRLHPRGQHNLLSDLDEGPVLFATC